MQTVYGVLTDRYGHASKTVAEQGPLRPELRFRAWATPSDQVRSVQNEKIPIDIEHSGIPVGEVVYLERTKSGDLWCVGEVRDDVLPVVHVRVGSELVTLEHDLYWSATRIGGPDLGIVITDVALTATPARISPRPVKFLPDSIGYRSIAKEHWHLRDFELELMTRAANSHLDRRKTSPREPLVVHGEHPRPAALELRRARSIEVRSATAVEVHASRRELDLLVAPAESPTVIYERSRSYVEVISHGAFAGCEQNPEKVKVNMHHERTRTIGKALALEPWAEAGLEATVRLAKVADADEALAMVDEELLGVSAGFAVEADEWQGTKQRRVKRALLDHIALTPVPAYETANVLAARGHELAY